MSEELKPCPECNGTNYVATGEGKDEAECKACGVDREADLAAAERKRAEAW